MPSILVVEDIEIHRDFFALLLERMPQRTSRRTGGAVAAARSERYDVIFMDIQMPVMDGCTKRLRQIQARRRRALGRISSRCRGRSCPRSGPRKEGAGMDDFVLKPTKLADLTSVLARAHQALAQRAGGR